MLKWLTKKLLKLYEKIQQLMNPEIIQQISTYRDFFLHKQMQWIKPADQTKMANVVTVSDVFNRGRDIYAQLSDGTTLPVTRLNSDLMMITNDNPVMSREQVMSINADPGIALDGSGPSDEYNPYEDPSMTTQHEVPKTIQEKMGTPFVNQKQEEVPIQTDRRITDKRPIANIFDSFTAEKTNLNLSLNINLPPLNLLKMMYGTAKDKEDFLKNLCSHINNQITESVIHESIIKKIDPKKSSLNERNI